MPNLLLSPVYTIDPDEYTHKDKVFRREYPHHIIRLGTQAGVFWSECIIDRHLYDTLIQSYDSEIIREKCQIQDLLHPDTDGDQDIDQDFDPKYALAGQYRPSPNSPQQRTVDQLIDYLGEHTHTRYTAAGLSIHA